MENIIIAIDGHAGCGKSTTAKIIARELNYIYIDTGAMYRAVTFFLIQNRIDFADLGGIVNALTQIQLSFAPNPVTGKKEILLNGQFVESHIRTMQVTRYVSEVSAIPEVRKFLVAQQQQMGKGKGVVMDGRDIGTVVFPEADLKIFMTADIAERARRRQAELLEAGQEVPIETLIDNLSGRDYLDSTRKEGPLKKADDAVVIDTTNLTIDLQVEQILKLVHQTIS